MSRNRSSGGWERRAAARRAAHDQLTTVKRITYPSLPIAERHDELLEAINDHQVVIVAGETGSGKSTQIPKLCLEAGRGIDGVIGHTQPRRVAARTIAERVAEELHVELGHEVGYTVRFNDQVGDATLIRLMTDGILLAELQRDRMLRRYDTLIIDEAHERSLNIDFILGYVKQLLPGRPDLKVIVTSATIDTERFAAHFAVDGVPAPVVTVEGRTYPVEMRYRPFGPDHPDDPNDDRDQVQAIADAVDELEHEGAGDVLVFLSGEREIHDTADALRRRNLRNTEVLPLYARLSSVEQHRIFQPHPGRRIVLSTNVAETSLTVPGVRYVIDAGAARISRYSRRLKVQRLPIEAVSQASANQRAGRCGRVAPGICIRLFSEADFGARPEFTEPEILRTNLASVILQMTAIGLGDVAAFPFLEPPDSAAIRDGYLLLDELGAIEPDDGDGDRRVVDGDGHAIASVAGRRLTEIGTRLARLPVDPRLGRMVLEADRHGCVRELLVIAAALSIQDPRERPREHVQQADELHRRFDVGGSDLLSLVELWDHLREQQRQLSGNQFRRTCKAEYLNYLRVREWRDLYSQLRQVAGEMGIRPGTDAGHPDHVHRAILSGLLSHIGMRDGESREFRGARGSRFMVANGSVVSKRPPRWVMAAELVETNRLWARRVATIQPEWAETLAPHLVSRSYGEPWWDADRGRAVAIESVMLYGLPIVSGRTVGYDRVDPDVARGMFIRFAMVEGQWQTHHQFLTRNEAFRRRVHKLEARVRRGDLLDDDTLFDFYDRRLDLDITTPRHFDRWWKREIERDPHHFDLTDAVLAIDGRSQAGIVMADYPDTWQHGEMTLPLTYRFDPGGPLDGVTVHIPLTALNMMTDDGFDWLIPGYRFELVAALVRSLPKHIRRDLIPANETTNAAFDLLEPPSGRLVDRLAQTLSEVANMHIRAGDFDLAAVPPELRMNYVVADTNGEVLDAGSDLGEIQRRLSSATRTAIADAAPVTERRGITVWDIGDLPRSIDIEETGHTARAFPTLLDQGDSVSLRIVTNEALQRRAMRGGVRRLLLLSASPSAQVARRDIDQRGRLAIVAAGRSLDDILTDCIMASVDRVLNDHPLPWDEPSFNDVEHDVRTRAGGIAADAAATAVFILAAVERVRMRADRMIAASLRATAEDAVAHVERLVTPGFVTASGTEKLPDVHRYVRGAEFRLEKLNGEIDRDRRRMAEIAPLEERLAAYTTGLERAVPEAAIDIGWQIEELRMSLFAQALGVHGTVSSKRISRQLDRLGA